MDAIDLDLVENFIPLVEKFLDDIKFDAKHRLIQLTNKIIHLEYKRQLTNLEEIYFPKGEIAQELGCSIKTLTRDMQRFFDEGAISRRYGTYSNGERSIGNSLFIKVEQNFMSYKTKKAKIKELLMLQSLT